MLWFDILFVYLVFFYPQKKNLDRTSGIRVFCSGSSALIGQKGTSCAEGAGPLGREQEKKAGGHSKAKR